MTDSYRKTRKKPTTQLFKEDFFARVILNSLHWKGTHMLWPYNWDGYRRMARIRGDRLFKAIEFDLVYDPPEMPPPPKMLEKIVDNGTTVVTIPTPKGWKCPRKNCKADYLHEHGTYTSLKKKP